MEWRKNQGYIITNSITIGNSEFVLGVHETRPNAFVTWECKNKDDYFWGHYCDDLLTAQKDFLERAYNEAERLRPSPEKTTRKKQRKEPER